MLWSRAVRVHLLGDPALEHGLGLHHVGLVVADLVGFDGFRGHDDSRFSWRGDCCQ